MDDRVSVVLIDAAGLLRDGLARLLGAAGFAVRHTADSLDMTRDGLAGPAAIDLALIDFGPDPAAVADGLTRARAIFPQAGVVALSETYCPDHLIACLRAGIDGYLLKTVASETLIASLQLVMLGEGVLPAQSVDLLARSPVKPEARTVDASRLGARLSQREIEILRCLVQGDSNKLIARRLDIAEATVKVHIKTILRKIDLENRTQAAIWALHHGLGDKRQDEETPSNTARPGAAE